MNEELTKSLLRALRKLASQSSELEINELRIVLALERLIARLLSHPKLAKHLVFKGGFVLYKEYESKRFTRDADALAIDISKSSVKEFVQEAISTNLDDGMWYGDIQVKELEEQGQYGAYRFVCAFQVGEPPKHKIHKLPRVHIDVGFSDSLIEEPLSRQMSPLIKQTPLVSWKVYPVEQIIAEKLQTLFQRGSENSRARDVYDLVYLFPRCPDKSALLRTIRNTFEHRATPTPTDFYRGACEIEEQTFLKSAWKGLRVSKNKPPFDEAWQTLLNLLKELGQFD